MSTKTSHVGLSKFPDYFENTMLRTYLCVLCRVEKMPIFFYIDIVLICIIFLHLGKKEYTWHAICVMSHDIRFPTMWYVQPAKAKTSSLIRAFS